MAMARKPLPRIDDYPAFLERRWREAMAPREGNAPTVVSTFAGGGGSSLGYAMAGYRELAVTDWDADSCATLRRNFPGLPVLEIDIGDLSVGDLLAAAGIGPGELDVLDGSPPCQGFSLAGKRRVVDPRNDLFREFLRLLDGVRPKAFVMENVPGLAKGSMRPLFREMTAALKRAGYAVSCRELDAQWLGVPQSRKRLIWVGVRDGLGAVPGHPPPLRSPISVMEAIGDLLPGGTFMGMYDSLNRRMSSITRPANSLRASCALEVSVSSGLAPLAGRDVGSPSPALGTRAGYLYRGHPPPPLDDAYGELWGEVPPGRDAADLVGKGWQNCLKPDPGKPSPSLPAQQNGRGFATITHWSERRALTVAEGKRLQSFPDGYAIEGASYAAQWKQIGNSVPPLMMKAIAETVTGTLRGTGGGRQDQ